MSRTGKAEAYRDHFVAEISAVAAVDSVALDKATVMRKIVRTEVDPRRTWTTRIASWCIIGGRDKGNFHQFALQWIRGVPGGPRVRVGCKYKTLPQAWRYIREKGRGYERNKYAQAECQIKLLILKAQAADLPGTKGLKFDASIRKGQ